MEGQAVTSATHGAISICRDVGLAFYRKGGTHLQQDVVLLQLARAPGGRVQEDVVHTDLLVFGAAGIVQDNADALVRLPLDRHRELAEQCGRVSVASPRHKIFARSRRGVSRWWVRGCVQSQVVG
jgi:hypothetical protein